MVSKKSLAPPEQEMSVKLNEISALITEASWDFVNREDEAGYTNLLGAAAELEFLINARKLSK